MDHRDIVDRIVEVPLQNGRRIVAIAGGPASGKSTLSEVLQSRLPNCCVVPMDGFHRSNDDLKRVGLFERKGAPETFDVDGFTKVIASLCGAGCVRFPTFDRSLDSVVPDGGWVQPSDQTVLVEGNYLLSDLPKWKGLGALWDFRIRLNVPLDVLRARLVERWLDQGFDRQTALKRVEGNDLPNARLVNSKMMPADLEIGVC